MRGLQDQTYQRLIAESRSQLAFNGFAECHGRSWRYDDFTKCFQHDYLQTLFPLLIIALSALHLAIILVLRTYQSLKRHGYSPLKHSNRLWQNGSANAAEPSTSNSREYGPSEASSDITDIDDEIERNAQLALNPTVSQVNRTTYVEANAPTGQIYLVCIELLATLGSSVICIIALNTSAWGAGGTVAAAAGVVSWTYALLLVAVRLISSFFTRLSTSVLWYHTAFLYGLQWLFTTLLLRSYVLHPPSRHSLLLMSILFTLNTLLFLISLFSRRGNKAVEMEYEGDIPPAREPTASLFSRATFGWVDPIVWTGFKKTFELSDVWNLPYYDKSAFVLSNYRQLKKTSSLAWDLLRYFRVGLLTQAFWACLSGILTFTPTLLLREILQYVEQPDVIPRNSAWFFVLLLFVSGLGSALADGQALWTGRHTCIQLRAVIVGEIYAKALKRKVGASADKVLGADIPSHNKRGFVQKIKSLFGKSKNDSNKSSNEEAPKPTGGDDSQVTSGTIINLMAVDSFKVSEVSAYLHFLWASTPVQVVMAVVLLYKTLGFSSIAGIGMMLLLLPANLFIAQRWVKIQKKILAATDARIHTTNEVLTNIRIIKYFAWELRFIDTINESRVAELKNLRNRYILWASAATLWGGAPALITFLTFAVYTMAEHRPLIPSVAFTALSLFQILRIPLDQLADMIAHVQECKVSIDRVHEFLQEEDTQKYKQLKQRDTLEYESIIGFDDGTFSWDTHSNRSDDLASAFRLMDLNMRFHIGQLNIITGPTGSGKTSLLLALLGEMTLLNGKVFLPGARSREDLSIDPQTGLTDNVAYCAQQAWLVNGTVKENVVFASPWDERRYKQVIDACALEKDLQILDAGDQTLIGEKGVTLSGGQKQRISLARALYCNAKHLLLDDILSAVDSHTAKWIFGKAIMGPLMYNRTCILVTHNVSLCLPHADFAVILENGKVAAQGSALDVKTSGKLDEDFTRSIQGSEAPSRVSSMVNLEAETLVATEANGNVPNGAHGKTMPYSMNVKDHTTSEGTVNEAGNSNSPTNHETKAEGSVKLGIIVMYLKSMGSWFFWIVAASAFAAQQLGNLSTNVWIRQWANAYVTRQYSALDYKHQSHVLNIPGISHLNSCFTGGTCGVNLIFFPNSHANSTAQDGPDHVDNGYYLAVYGLLALAYMAITFFREGVLFYGSLAASRSIHQKLITAVSRAKFRFFDTTPLGQIMNRFSKDIENVDQEVAPVAVGVIHCFASIFTIVVLISVITPKFLIAGSFITLAYFFIGWFYINSSRDLKRLESVQRSPLYQQFGETLTGMTTIRAYGDERRFIRENLRQVNTHNRPFIYLWAANRWLAFRVDLAGALVSFFTGIFVVLQVGEIDPGAAGLALTYAITFTENVLWFVRLYAENEQNMNSVERIKEYMDVDQEADAIVPEARPPGEWPSQGSVQFVGYSTRYRKDYDLVLKNLNFKIAPGEKVGVVGRTGAGKSSLALAMFRALEAEEGQILIDDIDIGRIGLQDLRESIVMVPQDPTLFTGTIRSNLDPFSLFTDEEIFTALERVQLIGSVPASGAASTQPSTPVEPSAGPSIKVQSSLGDINSPTTSSVGENKNIFLNLSSPIAESGSNLSQGQRQLLCLARALLKAPRVLLMDEATASIDFATDSKVQQTIRDLKDKTIITIAHRLKTIVDYDKVIVMEQGSVVEIGDPWELLKPEGDEYQSSQYSTEKRWFREMCETSGDLEILEREAKKSWEARRLVDDS